MRKLVLFGVLALVFALALLLERVFTRPDQERMRAQSSASADDGKAIFLLGGGPPRSIPERAPEAAGDGDRDPATAPARQGPRHRTGTPQDPADSSATQATYKVRSGETLSSIARNHLGSTARWRQLAEWNGIEQPSALQAGMVLRLAPPAAAPPAAAPEQKSDTPVQRDGRSPPAAEPDTTTHKLHKVAQGETLMGIAEQYLGDKGRWREIQQLNGIAQAADLRTGQTLQIPAKSARSSRPASAAGSDGSDARRGNGR